MSNQSITRTIGIAVDLGSTNIGVSCFDMNHKVEICSFSFSNPQHIYGADIISRIKRCIEDSGNLEKMKKCVLDSLKKELQERLGFDYRYIKTIVYTGNTTMMHIIRGLAVDGLAYAPFKPVDLSYYCEETDGVTYHYLPGVSAFVGADILAGAYYLQLGNKNSYDLLIDLGTNGELLLINEEHGYATSTACGPVFDHVVTGAKYGSESMNVIAKCLKRGLIDSTGKLADSLFETGINIRPDMIIKQEHIRNFQLAKAAIYAGVQCLLEKSDIRVQDVDKVYISGGLGFYMDIEDVFTLNMLPIEWKNRIQICGNTSLEGAKQYMLANESERRHILRTYTSMYNRMISFELANLDTFNEVFIKSLEF